MTFIYCAIIDKIFEYYAEFTEGKPLDYYVFDGVTKTKVEPSDIYFKVEIRKTAIFLT
jgi:hypothetical protein